MLFRKNQGSKVAATVDGSTVVGAGLSSLLLFWMPVIRTHRFDANRRFEDLPVRLPHEALKSELNSSPMPLEALTRAVAEGDLPERYLQHPAVVAAAPGDSIHPFCLYMDGVSFTRNDSILAFWIYFLFTGCRHLVFVAKKSELCKCGCRGWCTLYSIWRMLAWSFSVMLSGIHPATKPNGEPWDDGSDQAAAAGTPLGFRALCLLVKADWAEFAGTMAFPGWADAISPCPLCRCTREMLYQLRGFSALDMPCAAKTLADY